MTIDPFDALFADADHPREMPAPLRNRLERALLTGDADLAGLVLSDAARPLPPALRESLEDTLLPAASRRLPARLRRRVHRTLAPGPVWISRGRIAAIAAAIVLLAATATMLTRQGNDTDDLVQAGPGTTIENEVAPGSIESVAGKSDGATAATGDSSAPSGAAASGSAQGGGSARSGAPASAAASASRYPPPPYARGESAQRSSAASEAKADEFGPTRGALRVGFVGGDPKQEAGFRAYVDTLNRAGGAAGHAINVIATSPAAPAASTIGTVNLSSQVVANSGRPAWAQAPLLESLAVSEEALRGDVFSFASVVERQAHLAADAAFPDASPGARAAIYHPAGGEFATRVPEALEAALRTKAITSVRVLYEPGATRFVAADAAFVSLPPAAARDWLSAAKGAGYAPARGTFGVWSLADELSAASMASNTAVLSPYSFDENSEAAALREAVGSLSARAIHGWVTAKAIAIAIWLTDADTAGELAAALERLVGEELGFGPAYEVRPGTRSRTPEAVLLAPESNRLASRHPFRRDRF